jgi:hypothetical protein
MKGKMDMKTNLRLASTIAVLLGVGVAAQHALAAGSAADIAPVAQVSFDKHVTAHLKPSAEQLTLFQAHLQGSEQVAHLSRTSFGALGKNVLSAKLLDPVLKRTRIVSIDERSGLVEDMTQLAAENRASMRRQFGAAAPDLANQMTIRAVGEKLKLIIALDHTLQPDALAAVQAQITRLGAQIRFADGEILRADATPDQMQQIATLAGVAGIEEDQQHTLALTGAFLMGQPGVIALARNGIGDLRAAIVEPDACILRSHRDFPFVQWEARIGLDGPNCNISRGHHSTKVAGMLAAARGGFGDSTKSTGVWGAKLFEAEHQSLKKALERNPDLVNLSYTIGRFDVRALDEAVYQKRMFIANASGNDERHNVYCYSYNSLCVGGFVDNNTKDNFHDDLAVATYLNDPRTGREEPKVVGPTSMKTIADDDGLYTSTGGTSFASPAVLGVAGQLISAHPQQFKRNPTLLRAVLMASARRHAIHWTRAQTASLPRVPDFDDSIDDRKGVGAPNGYIADAIVNAGQFRYENFTPAKEGVMLRVNMQFKTFARFVLTWDNCPQAQDSEALTVDLDMHIYKAGTNTLVARNISSADNYEVIDQGFLLPGDYDVVVTSSHWNSCAYDGTVKRVPMALAWIRANQFPSPGGSW